MKDGRCFICSANCIEVTDLYTKEYQSLELFRSKAFQAELARVGELSNSGKRFQAWDLKATLRSQLEVARKTEGIPKVFFSERAKIQRGEGVPRMDASGSHTVYQGRENPNWRGALEYDVPRYGEMNRILHLVGIDSHGVPYERWGWTQKHYGKTSNSPKIYPLDR